MRMLGGNPVGAVDPLGLQRNQSCVNGCTLVGGVIGGGVGYLGGGALGGLGGTLALPGGGTIAGAVGGAEVGGAAGAVAGSAAGHGAGEKLCPDDDDKCDPPEGTICSEFHSDSTPHKVTDFEGNKLPAQDWHVHTWQMNKSPKGCYWNKRRQQKYTFNFTPIDAKSCYSYQSWRTQEGK